MITDDKTTAAEVYFKHQQKASAEILRREELIARLRDECREGTERAMRAAQAADSMLALFRTYVPEACWKEAHSEAQLAFFAANAGIITKGDPT